MRRTEQATSVNLNWPHLRTARRNPLRASLAKWLFLRNVRNLRLSVTLPDGSRHGKGEGRFGAGGDPNLTINDPDAFFSRIGRDGSLGFGEAYLLGAWDCGRSRHRFVQAYATVTRLGFDDTFCRLWVLYFAYFEAGFRARYCDVWQVGIRKAG
jgi:hypothetical protein